MNKVVKESNSCGNGASKVTIGPYDAALHEVCNSIGYMANFVTIVV